MSNDFLKMELRRNIPSQLTFRQHMAQKQQELMQIFGPPLEQESDFDNITGLSIERHQPESEFIYDDNGYITGLLTTIRGKDTDVYTYQEPHNQIHTIKNKQGQVLEETLCDEYGIPQTRSVYDSEGNISVIENMQAGKVSERKIINNNGSTQRIEKFDEGELIESTDYKYLEDGRPDEDVRTSSRYPDYTKKYEYDTDGSLAKIHNTYEHGYNNTEVFEAGQRTSVIYYDKEGNVDEVREVVNAREIHPAATQIADGKTVDMERINQISITGILNDFKVKSPDKNIIEAILENDNIPDKQAFINHILSTLKESVTEHADLYYDDRNAAFYGILDETFAGIPEAASKNAKDIAAKIDLMIDYDFVMTDRANGRIDKATYQGYTADCWMLAGINSLAMTPGGQELLNSCLKADEAGNVTVKLKGGEKIYTITAQELRAASHLSIGDYDVRAIEIAMERYFAEEQPYGQDNINGGQKFWLMEAVTGRQVENIVVDDELPVNTPLRYIGNPDQIFDALEGLQPNVAITCSAIIPGGRHAYIITKIDGDNIHYTDPHNISAERTMTREEFKENFDGGIEFMILEAEQ